MNGLVKLEVCEPFITNSHNTLANLWRLGNLKFDHLILTTHRIYMNLPWAESSISIIHIYFWAIPVKCHWLAKLLMVFYFQPLWFENVQCWCSEAALIFLGRKVSWSVSVKLPLNFKCSWYLEYKDDNVQRVLPSDSYGTLGHQGEFLPSMIYHDLIWFTY
jgi:hypothetical protein